MPTRRPAIALAIVLAIGAAVRAVVVYEVLSEDPLARTPVSDAEAYWAMAGDIARGRLVQDHPFFNAPLYPYLLGLGRALGAEPAHVIIIQVLLHLATAGLIARIAHLVLGRWSAVTAAALFLLLQDPLFDATRLLATTLQTFAVTVAALGIIEATRNGRRRSWAVAGLLTGIAALAWPPALLMIAAVAVLLFVRRPGARGALSNATAFALAAAIAIAPATVHNWMACGEPILLIANSGTTFAQGNNPTAAGTYAALPGISRARLQMHADAARIYEQSTGRQPTWRAVSAWFWRQGLRWWWEEPARAAALIFRKLYWFLSGHHYHDIYFPLGEIEAGWADTLRLAPLPVPWLMGAAAVGSILLVRRRGGSAVLLVVAVALVAVLVFRYSPRYRLVATPALCVLAAVGATALWRARPRVRPVALAGVIAGPALPFINIAAGFDRPGDYHATFAYNVGSLALHEGRLQEALARFEEALRASPDFPDAAHGRAAALLALGRLEEARAAIRGFRRRFPHDLRGDVLHAIGALQSGDIREADARLTDLAARHPYDPDILYHLALCRLAQDRLSEAADLLRETLRIRPTFVAARINLAGVLHPLGRTEEAVAELTDLIAAYPRLPQAHYNLGTILAEEGRLERAINEYYAALEADPTYTRARVALMLTLADAGRLTEAVTLAEQAIRDAEAEAGLLHVAAVVFQRAGRLGEAREALERARAADPDNLAITGDLAWFLASCPDRSLRDVARAVALAERVRAADPASLPGIRLLADVLAAAGRSDEALAVLQQAADEAARAGDSTRAETLRSLLEDYRARRPPPSLHPVHEPPSPDGR